MNQSSTSVAINLRNKGLRNTSGNIIKGCVKDATTKLSIGSIPSNYQTIIYQHNSTKAFGSSQKRFYQETKTQLDKTALPDESLLTQQHQKNNVSYSKKGYGPFIAKQQRNWVPKNCSPGPGRYDEPKTAQTDTKKKKRKKYSPCFVPNQKIQNKLQSETQNKINNIQTPGPGQYQILDDKSINNGWKSAFKSKLNRSSYIPNNKNPGPGFYDVKLAKEIAKVKNQNKENVNSPDLSPKKIFQVFDKQVKNEIPGPGSYEHEIPSFKPLYERIKISGNFMLSKKDRFNNQIQDLKGYERVQDIPNIYSYNMKSTFDEQKRLLKWPCFMSQSKRMPFNVDGKLGPSFLSPKLQSRKNCHFNIKGDWI